MTEKENQVITNIIYRNISSKDMTNLIIELEKQYASMDFTLPLYKYFKSIVEKEDPDEI